METVEQFFTRFASMTAAEDDNGLVALHAPQFLVGGNAHGTQILSQPALARVIPKRKQILRSFGCGDARLQACVETKLDEKLSIVRAEWEWHVAPPSAPPYEVTVASTYIVERTDDDRLQIVAYFAHGDIAAEIRRRGDHR
jgi:hypothetical protein